MKKAFEPHPLQMPQEGRHIDSAASPSRHTTRRAIHRRRKPTGGALAFLLTVPIESYRDRSPAVLECRDGVRVGQVLLAIDANDGAPHLHARPRSLTTLCCAGSQRTPRGGELARISLSTSVTLVTTVTVTRPPRSSSRIPSGLRGVPSQNHARAEIR